jgi:hypothetical protein
MMGMSAISIIAARKAHARTSAGCDRFYLHRALLPGPQGSPGKQTGPPQHKRNWFKRFAAAPGASPGLATSCFGVSPAPNSTKLKTRCFILLSSSVVFVTACRHTPVTSGGSALLLFDVYMPYTLLCIYVKPLQLSSGFPSFSVSAEEKDGGTEPFHPLRP